MPAGSAALQWYVNRAPLVVDRGSAALQILCAGSRARVASMVGLYGAATLRAPRALRHSPLLQWAACWRCERAAAPTRCAKASICLGREDKERERERERESRGQTHKTDGTREAPRRPAPLPPTPPHPNINRALRRSASEVRRDPVQSTWFALIHACLQRRERE